ARLHRGERGLAARRVAARAGSFVRVRAAVARVRRADPGACVRSDGGAGRMSARGQSAEAPPVRVLVVDDEPQIVRALRVVLREAGFEAVPAETASQALDQAAVRPPDAAIVDLVLPDGDGVDVTRRLREWTEMPIIVLSAV